MKAYTALLFGALIAVPAACTPEKYARQADRAAYTALDAGQATALGEKKPFDVEHKPLACDKDPGRCEPIPGSGKIIPIGGAKPTVLTLDESLQVAFRNSRSFQTAREDLYTSALALANARREWEGTLFGGDATASYFETGVLGEGGADKSGAAGVAATLTRKFAQGGALALGASVSMATDFLGSRSTPVGSLLEANFTQPLLRGAWRDFAYEAQYRLERDFLFAVFGYERFTQTFAAGIVSDYYSVLQRRDQIANDESNIARLKETVALTRVLVEGGQVSKIEEDQAEQDLLNAQVRYETDLQGYQDALDNFKITLGLPMAANVDLDYPGAFDALRDRGLQPIDFDQDKAMAVALSVRPDVLSQQAKVRDARRDVEIAADKFLPQLDLAVGLGAAGRSGQHFWQSRVDEPTRQFSVVFDYPLDQTDHRDEYRRSLIAQAKADRDYAQFVDNVRREVRGAYRALVQSRRSYEIQLRNVEIARRRTLLAAMQQKEGLASARDVLEAEEALRNAQNGLTGALLGYTTTRLEFLAGLGLLSVDDKGQIHERREPFQFTRLQERYK